MSTNNHSSAEASRHPYTRRGFWTNPDNQFWHSPLYSDSYRERMNALVNTFYKSQLDLIKTK